MLQVSDLQVFYGVSQALFGVSLEVNDGEVVTLLGRNGMGKTTTVNSIMGIVRPASGSIVFNGAQIGGQRSFRIAQAGLGLVPEGRQIFPNLSVSENLIVTAADRRRSSSPWTFNRVMDMFPEIARRADSMGNLLSGGEQQMLAIGRALMTNPRLLILDEATEGLAPLVRADIWNCLQRIKEEGMSILVIDKNIRDLLKLASRHYILERGQVVWQGNGAELTANPDVQARFLGV
ncbi:MAG: ABC transporter ATP-binding protein [Burkholderiaceae bacterium]